MSNEERRERAKSKLDRHLAEQARRAHRRRMLIIAGSSVAGVAAVAVAVVSVVFLGHDDKHVKRTSKSAHSSGPNAGVPALPPFKPSAELGADCEYAPAPEPAAKPVDPPAAGKVPTDPVQVAVSVLTDQGRLGLRLSNNESPCAVNSFTSLARQNFFDDTRCHRLTTSPTLGVLQCGDPKGDGTGGPGYQFASEYPADQFGPGDPKAHQPVLYPRGTVATANTGEGTNGSQFFLMYKDSRLPPEYTVLGRIDAAGLAALDSIAKAGVAGGGQDGPPVTGVTIKSVTVG
jgi:peptidyl-prolyl cis-trans isomerase B (cyclophilin B)